MDSFQYIDHFFTYNESRNKDKTVESPCYLHNEDSYIDKTAPLH